jgi:hypothetical protein
MAKNIEETHIHRIQNSQFFSLQVDESTDIADDTNLMCFVRYDFKGSIQEDFLLCKPLQTRTTADEIFKLINDFIIQSGIDWKKMCWTEQRWCSVNGSFPHWTFLEGPSSSARLCMGIL